MGKTVIQTVWTAFVVIVTLLSCSTLGLDKEQRAACQQIAGGQTIYIQALPGSGAAVVKVVVALKHSRMSHFKFRQGQH